MYKIKKSTQTNKGGENMKKWFIGLLCMISLVGCSLGKDMTNTPTKKVEAYLDGYKSLDDSVIEDIDDLLTDTEYTLEQRTRYKDLMKKHYKDIQYEIKDEKINGDKATVEDEEGNYSEEEYYNYQLDQMEKVEDKVKYTVTFYLTKVNNDWVMDELSESNKQKIHGIYIY